MTELKNSIKQMKLNNGINLVVEEMPLFPVVAVQAWVGVGSADEIIESEAGISHVIEHMMFKGTKNRAVGEVAAEIESAGGSLNAWTSFDETAYHMILPAKKWKLGIEVLSDMLLNSLFDEEELTREKEVILEEVHMGDNRPGHITSENIFKLAYGSYGYGTPIIGNEDSVKSFKQKDIKAFIKKWYKPSNITFIVAGDVNASKIKTELETLFKDVRGGKKVKKNRGVYKAPPSAVKVHEGPFNEAYMNIAIGIKEYSPKYSSAVDLLSMILGDGESSRIQKRLKYSLKLVLDSYAYAFTPKYNGLFTIGTVLKPQNIEACIKETVDLLYGLRSITLDELNTAKITIKTEEIDQMQTVQGMAKKRGSFNIITGSPEGDTEYLAAIESITLNDLYEVLEEILASNRYLAITLPEGSSIDEKIIKKLLLSKKKKTRISAVKEKQFRKFSFPGGAKLLVMEDHSLPFISLRCGWIGGLLTENSSNSGISPLMSSVLQRGTLMHDGDDVHRLIEGRGGTLLSFSGRNSFGLRLDTLSETWEENLDLLLETIVAPSWDDREIETAKERILEGLKAEKDRHSSQVLRLFEKGIYGKNHPYGLNISGNASVVKKITRQRVVKWWKKHYSLNDMVITAVGDINADKLYKRFEHFLSLNKSKPTLWKPETVIEEGFIKKESYLKSDIKQSHILLGAQGTKITSFDRFPLEIIAKILSGQSGRLFLDLRDKQSLAYSVSAFSLEGVAPGYFASYIATRPSDTQKALDGLKFHLEKLVNEKVSKSELKSTINYMVGTHDIGLQRRSSLCAAMFYGELYGLGWDSYSFYSKNLVKVTPDDIKMIAQKYLSPDKLCVAVYGPENIF